MITSRRPKSLLATLAATIALLTVLVMPASAITKGGVVDTEENFPHVGLMVAFIDGAPAWRCTGTLVSPVLFVTAGHCTFGADHVEIWFDYDLTDAVLHSYPAGPGDASGTPHAHVAYDDSLFFLHDLGVVVLDEAYYTEGLVYANLPSEGLLNSLKPGNRSTFTTVGYGLQESYPPAAGWKNVGLRLRLVATPHLLQINKPNVGDFAMLLSNNSASGGTCFGDSGGPTFIGQTIVAVTSYGLTYTCAGVGGVYRIDQPDDLGWLFANFSAQINFPRQPL